MSKLSKFLKSNGLNALANAVTGNPVGAITSLFGVTGENTEEGILKVLGANSEALSEVREKEIEYATIIMKDRDSARRREVDINNSINSSWLTKNIVAILALIWTTASIYIFYLALIGKITTEAQIVMLVVNSVTNIIMLIVGYFFGSSEKSKS